ncbi:hypothetical protein pb186bvf_013843 [Paramecium bursaria]
MLELNQNFQIYKKTYTITDTEFNQLFIEMDLYFHLLTKSTINIYINSQMIFSQIFAEPNLILNSICGTGVDSQFTIRQGFYSKQQILQVQIDYIQSILNSNSFVGVKNINIYSNGIPLINGCPITAPFKNGGICQAQCPSTHIQEDHLQINAMDLLAEIVKQNKLQQHKQINGVQILYPLLFQLLDSASSQYYILNNNQYNNIFTNPLLSNKHVDLIYPFTSNWVHITQSSKKVQFGFVFYILGEWNDNSAVMIQLNRQDIHNCSLVTISKQNGVYKSSSQQGIYYTNLTNSAGQTVIARKTLVTFSANLYDVWVSFAFFQVLYGSTAQYGFGDITFYEADQVQDYSSAMTELYGQLYKCLGGLFAYNGTCRLECPAYAIKSLTNSNCTDYSNSESQIFDTQITTNLYGIYIIKEFYQNNYQPMDITNTFQTTPPLQNNYLNGQLFSFLQSNKIIGGYNSWGYGSYGAQFTSLKAHQQIRIYFRLFLIDDHQSGDNFQIYIDGSPIGTFWIQTKITQLQGLSILDYTTDVVYKQFHSSSTLTLQFQCNIAQQDASKASCGISNLFVLIDQNIDILCPLETEFFSYTTQKCEKCQPSPCSLFPGNTISSKCNIGCLTCTSYIACTSCDTANGYQLFAGLCICRDGYILISSQLIKIKQKCHYQCKTCSGTSASQCHSCDQTRSLVGSTCPCNINYVDVISQPSCALVTTQCHYSCLSCFGLQYYQCISCPTNSFRTFQASLNQCDCDTGYYDSGYQQCTLNVLCDESCLTCDAPGKINCTTCDDTKYRSLQSSGLCVCEFGYNDILSPGKACVQNFVGCHYTCLTCFGSTKQNCLTCDAINFRKINSHQCLCENAYTDIGSEKCQMNFYPCDQSCETCFGELPNQCLTCLPPLSISNNICKCLQGSIESQCKQCDSTCLTCDGPNNTQCLTCDMNSFRFLKQGECVCTEGYQESDHQICTDCLSMEGKLIVSCNYKNQFDGIWTYGEQCDDGNNDLRDGCTDFKIDSGYQCENNLFEKSICYKCPQKCTICKYYNDQIQCSTCLENYFALDNKCYKCQDENCLICRSSSFCTQCISNIIPINGKCQLCDYGYKWSDGQCQTICGDGIKTKEEQCDDYNLFNNDGCDLNCQIEQGFNCNPYCVMEQNDIKAKLFQSSIQKNYIQVETINYNLDLTQLDIKIEYFNLTQDFTYNTTSINLNKFEINLQFYKSTKPSNIIHVYLQIQTSQRLLENQIREIQIIPEEVDYYDSTQVSQRQSIQTTQSSFYQSLAYIGLMTVLVSGTNYFLKYQIFQAGQIIFTTLISIILVMCKFFSNNQIGDKQQVFHKLNNNLLPQKFQDKEVDSLILNNIQQILVNLIIIIVCIPLSKRIKIIIQTYSIKKQNIKVKQIQDKSQFINIRNQQTQKQQYQFNYLTKAIFNKVSEFYQNRYSILLQTINIAILDIILSIMINLKYEYYFNEPIQTISLVLCMIMMALSITYFYCTWFILNINISFLKVKWFRNLIDQLFQGIKDDKISKLYGFLSIFQKSLFIIFIVLFFERPLLQTLFCTAILSGQIIVALYQYPFRQLKDFFTQFIPDLSLSLILLQCTILAADEQINYFSPQTRYNFGWMIIGVISISIIIQLIFIFKEFYEQILIKVEQIRKLLKK